jgi:sec-independent protein translocase protein TatB
VFDIGFSELVVIGLVALIVIGPERLPRVARTVGHLLGRLQRYVADVKADISREVELEELRKMRDSVQEAAAGFENSDNTELAQSGDELKRSIAMDADGAMVGGVHVAGPAAAPPVPAPESTPATQGPEAPAELPRPADDAAATGPRV